MGNQNDIFIVKVHKAFQGIQEFTPYLVPCPERIVRFMGDPHLLIHIQAAMLIQIFQKVNHNRFESVFLLFQFGNRVLKHIPSKRSFRLPTLNLHFIPDTDKRRINELDITIRVQHKRIGKAVCKGGFSAKRNTINPKHTLLDFLKVSSFVFGQLNHVIPSFHTIILKFTKTAKIAFACLRELCFLIHRFYSKQEINHLLGIEPNLNNFYFNL